MNQLPDYMKLTYEALLDTFVRFEQDLANQGRSKLVPYVRELVCMTILSKIRKIKDPHFTNIKSLGSLIKSKHYVFVDESSMSRILSRGQVVPRKICTNI